MAAQGGGAVDAATGAIVPPIHVATTFVRDADNQYRRGYCYGRSDNATVRQVEDILTEVEGGASSLLFASGMAAATAAFLSLERPAHVVAPTAMYWGLRQWLAEDAPSHGLEVTFVDAGNARALARGNQARPHEARLGRDSVEPDLGHHGYRGSGALRACGRRAVGHRLHGVDAGADPPARARRRYRAALGHQVSQRPFRCRRRRAWCSRARGRPWRARRGCG